MIFQSRARCASPRVLTVGFHLLLLAWTQPGAAQAAAAATAGDARTLPSVEVVGIPQDDGVVPRRSSSATRTDTPLIETPQSLSVITREQMDARNVRSVNEAFRYAPGVATESWGAVTAYDDMSIRGFSTGNGPVDTFLDGMRLNRGVVFGGQQVDPFLLERMEVLRGPASVLYGTSTPGGVIALTSKLPREDAVRLIELEGGTSRYRRGSFDLGGKADERGTLLFRVVGTAMNSDGQLDGTWLRRRAVAPSLTWQPSAATRLTLYARYQDDPGLGMISSVPGIGSVLPNPHGQLPPRFNVGEPGYDTFARTIRAVGYQLDQKLAGDWSMSLNGRYTRVDSDYDAVVLAALQPDLRTIDRQVLGSTERYDSFTLDNQLKGRFATGAARHELLAGLVWEQMRGDGDYRTTYNGTKLDIYSPVYGAPQPVPPTVMDKGMRSTLTGLYVQDQVALGNWHTTVGVRQDWSTIDSTDRLWHSGFTQKDQATTVRVGTLYRFGNGLAPYATYAQSFEPVNSLSASGEPFKPTRGELFETGLKYQPENWDALFSAAIYHLTQTNVLSADPANPRLSVQSGEVRSRGLELEAHARLSPQWSVIAAYTWQNVEYTKGNANEVGRTPSRVPTRFGGVWLAWDAPSGWGAALGVRHNGGSWGGYKTLQDFRVPGYTLVDAQLHYDLGRQVPSLKGTKVQLNVSNLTDKRYSGGCYDLDNGCFAGAGRVVSLKVGYQW